MANLVREKTPPKMPRGIYEKVPGSKMYWIRYTDAAGKLRRERGGSTLTSSLDKLTRRRNDKLDGKIPEPRNEESDPKSKKVFSLGDLIDGAIKNKARNLSIYDLKLKLERIRVDFGARPADSITQDEIVDWLNEEMEERGWKPPSRNRYQSAWSLIYHVGMTSKKVGENPAAGIGKLQENNSRVRSLSMWEEVTLRARIAKYCPGYVPIFDLSLHTGMRTSELLRGVVGDYDDFTGMLTVHQRKNRNAPAFRYVPLTPIGVAAYNTLAAGKKKGEPLCINIVGDKMKSLRYWLITAIKDLAIEDFTPHDMRHTAASRWVMAGVPLAVVAGYLGHANIQMTMRYAHLQPGNKARAIEAMMSYYAPMLGEGESQNEDNRGGE